MNCSRLEQFQIDSALDGIVLVGEGGRVQIAVLCSTSWCLFPATQDVHDGDACGGHVDSGIPGIWRRVGGHGGGDLVTVSRRGEQLAAVSVAGPGAGMAVPGTGGR